MTNEDARPRTDRKPDIDQRDGEFVDRLEAHYPPRPWTPAERAQFDAELRARIERPPRRGFPLPALAALAVALLAWIGFGLLPDRNGSSPDVASVWESELFLSSDVSPLDDRDEGEGLPEDYLAIASLFMDG